MWTSRRGISACCAVVGPEQFGPRGRRMVARRTRRRRMSDSNDPAGTTAAWKHDGVRVIPGDRLDPNTAQTPGMDRKAAINLARVGAQKLWAGTVHIHPNAKTGAHHHGAAGKRDLRGQGPRAHALGRGSWSSSPRPGRATSSTCRPTCRTRRSTPPPTRRWNACWCAATARRWR